MPASLDNPLGRALAAASTSNSWSTLEAVAAKAGKRLGRKVTPGELDALMKAAGDDDLRQCGVWRTGFGAKYMPIVLVNPAYGRARAAAAEEACSCGTKLKKVGSKQRYFSSHDYNAGRHSVTTSAHKANCVMWTPPDAGHLHSWRRKFQE